MDSQQIGTALRRVETGTIEMNSNVISITECLSVAEIKTLPARLDDRLLAKVKATAIARLPALPRCDEDHFDQVMRSLSLLPRRGDDELTAKLRVKLYHAKLGHYPNDALSMLASEGLARFKFFPSIAECLELLGTWQRADDALRARNLAEHLVRLEMNTRLDETLARLRRGEMDLSEIDAMPERWKAIAETRMLLWRHPDGTYSRREVTKASER